MLIIYPEKYYILYFHKMSIHVICNSLSPLSLSVTLLSLIYMVILISMTLKYWCRCNHYYSLLLFAKLQDYPQCQALANIWLRNRDNYTDAEYPHIVDIYVQRVMFPWKLHSLVPAFLDTCLGLDATQRQLMMQVCITNM